MSINITIICLALVTCCMALSPVLLRLVPLVEAEPQDQSLWNDLLSISTQSPNTFFTSIPTEPVPSRPKYWRKLEKRKMQKIKFIAWAAVNKRPKKKKLQISQTGLHWLVIFY